MPPGSQLVPLVAELKPNPDSRTGQRRSRVGRTRRGPRWAGRGGRLEVTLAVQRGGEGHVV